jgi:hypothetical protein
LTSLPPLPPVPLTGAAYEAGRLARAAMRKQWTTPRRLFAFRTATWVLAALLLLVGETTLNRGRVALRTIAKDTAPSIVAAADIGTALADIDANVANGILGNAAHRAAAESTIERERLRVSEGILRAAENVTAGDAEKVPIRAMNLDLGRYLERQAEARLFHDTGDEGTARDRYWTATALLHDNLLAFADQLDNAKKTQMDAAYGAQHVANEGSEILASFVGGLLCLTLLWAQWFLVRRMRRMLNVPLLLATLAALGLTLHLARCFSDTREDLRVAKVDAFDSIYSLVRARTIAHDAKGDASRFLLDASPRRGLEREWNRKVALLTATPDMFPNAKTELAQANPKAKNHVHTNTKGILWDEVRNITFDREYEAAVAMMNAFADYYAIDKRVRGLSKDGKLGQALEIGIGTESNEANAAFDRFDQALDKTRAINQAAFDDATGRAEAELKRAELVDPGMAILIAVLAWLGIRPRLREYQA